MRTPGTIRLRAETGLHAPLQSLPGIAELALIGRFVIVPDVLYFNRDHPARFTRTALLDRTASWLWWCGPDIGMPSSFWFYRRCPNWHIQLTLTRIIKKHLTEPAERYRTYFPTFSTYYQPTVVLCVNC
jgi:hypothetical protein